MVFLRVPLGGRIVPITALVLSAVNAFFTLGTILCLALWPSRDDLGELARSFLIYGLGQTHLGTENVIAAWYSSMLLLAVSLGALAAYTTRSIPEAAWTRPWLRHGWLIIAGIFLLLSFDEIGSMHERVGMALWSGGDGGTWVYVLAIPILATGAYMLAFAWTQMRRIPAAFRLFVIGTALYVLNPILEAIGLSLLTGAGADPESWGRFAHDVLLVIEEGGLELFGTLCFLVGVLLWLRESTRGLPARTLSWRVDAESAARIGGATALLVVVGVPVSAGLMRALPPADTGIAMNWFPAAASFLLCALALAAGTGTTTDIDPRRKLALATGTLALVISAYFGADIHGYATWGRFDMLRELSRTFLTVGFAVLCVSMSKRPSGEHIGALLVAAILMAGAINVAGPHAALAAALGAIACGTGIASQAWVPAPDTRVSAQSTPRIAQRSGNAGRPTVA